MEGWGKFIVEKLSSELQKEFMGTGGFSTTKPWYMAKIPAGEYCRQSKSPTKWLRN